MLLEAADSQKSGARFVGHIYCHMCMLLTLGVVKTCAYL
jgi:hypothetical protein